MTITVCVGSSCHLKGSQRIVQELQSLLAANQMEDRIELNGAFCMGNCTDGVCVQIDGNNFSLAPEDTRYFFEKEVMAKL